MHNIKEGISKKKTINQDFCSSVFQSNGFVFLALYSIHFAVDLHNKPKMLSTDWGQWL